jgi:hypothetical protein
MEDSVCLPSGNLTIAIENGPFRSSIIYIDLPINTDDFP